MDDRHPDLHHMIFSGPEFVAGQAVDAFTAGGFPTQVDEHRGGFDHEHGVVWLDVLGDGRLGDVIDIVERDGVKVNVFEPGSPLEIAGRFGLQLRLHEMVVGPLKQAGDPRDVLLADLQARIALLEARS